MKRSCGEVLCFLGLIISQRLCYGFVAVPSYVNPKNIGCPLFSSSSSSSSSEVHDNLSFADLGLKSEILCAVASQAGWRKPTEVQKLAIPKLLDFGNAQTETSVDAVWCEAPTGSGKTASWALPLLQNFHQSKNDGRITSLVLCPTRELAAQIGSVVNNLANNAVSYTHLTLPTKA